jgi:hypothetical protein
MWSGFSRQGAKNAKKFFFYETAHSAGNKNTWRSWRLGG